jgi:hypothetical protein
MVRAHFQNDDSIAWGLAILGPGTVTARANTMTTITPRPIDLTERVRRREMVRDTRAVVEQGDTFEQRTKHREDKANHWTDWFHAKMEAAREDDPVQLLPDAFARLEQMAEDRIAAAIKELKATLREVLK